MELKTGDTVDVGMCNNADETRLIPEWKNNGHPEKEHDDLHVQWAMPYMPGELKVVSRKNGRTILTKRSVLRKADSLLACNQIVVL